MEKVEFDEILEEEKINCKPTFYREGKNFFMVFEEAAAELVFNLTVPYAQITQLESDKTEDFLAAVCENFDVSQIQGIAGARLARIIEEYDARVLALQGTSVKK